MKRFVSLSIMSFALSLTLAVNSAARDMKDQAGAKDHPLVSRFAGSTLYRFGEMNFEQVELGIGDGKRITIEGKIQNYMYFGPSDRTELEIYRSFKEGLERGGFKVIFACENQDNCKATDISEHARKWTGASNSFKGGYSSTAAMTPQGRNPKYLVAKLDRTDGAVTAVLTTTSESSSAAAGGKAYFLQMIQEKAIAAGQVVVTTTNANELRTKLQAEGRIAIYGVQFATGKSVVLPGSKEQLVEMAKYLQADAGIKVFVMGHTDNQGNLESNLALSQQRADAVAKALTSDFKIDAKRLAAKGIANYSPVTTNATEAGRAKNRRVELVVQ
jgi:OmpA-OmpF porin, OOP family